jgi:nitroreductase
VEVFEAARTALAVREYQDRPVPRELVARIVESARLTGSSQNGQPWHFIVVDDRETLQRIGELAPFGPYVAQAPLAVVVALEESRFGESDAGRAIQSMILTAWAEGVGSSWIGYYALDALNPLLGIPERIKVFAVVPFGYPSRPRTGNAKRRRPPDEVIHYGRFGQHLVT